MKGMVLAAGFGTRLAPLTDVLPKPMFPACNMPLIDFALHRLALMGVFDVVVNLHHLPSPIREHLKHGSRFDQEVAFSEEPRILGTGGGIKAVREWCGKETLCITNGDTLLLTELESLVEAHKNSGALATLAVLRHPSFIRHGGATVNEAGEVVHLGLEGPDEPGRARGVFVGLHLIEPELFNRMPDTDHFCIVRDVYQPLIKSEPGSVRGHFVNGMFFDMGTPSDYLLGNISLMQSQLHASSVLVEGMRHLGDNVFVGNGVQLGRGVSMVGPCLVGDGAKIEGGSEIGPNAVVGAGALLGPWTRARNAVIWPGALYSSGGMLKNTVVYDRTALPVDLKPDLKS
jgi:mannose-1-phosphate guanylyltransferase